MLSRLRRNYIKILRQNKLLFRNSCNYVYNNNNINSNNNNLLYTSYRSLSNNVHNNNTNTFNDNEHTSHILQTNCGLYIDQALPPTFDKILIANRGEIACRVIRTCRRLNIKTVAVYSDADINSQHVKMADEAYRVGPPAANESYLLGDKILEIAKLTGAQAIHPGYGFLSENAEFCKKCADNNVIFIGPPIGAIESMGSKSASKSIMLGSGVPCVPGYHGADQSLERLKSEATKVGYPLMIKAVLGGGGKGMRIVYNEEDFEESLMACMRESKKSFSDDRVLLERYIERPRHIEFQIFADHYGNTIHFFERDCSVQRRHQKVLEEAPAPGMTYELRREMGLSAVNAAKAVGYVGAGTVEFIVDDDTNDYFFMEMNTRLQVEHPVSEMVSGRDFVQLQLHVAKGYKLPFTQEQANTLGSNTAQPYGHALEARVYAENPDNQFLPATGTLQHLITPKEDVDSVLSNENNANIRVETGVVTGDEVSIFYDPMIAKLIVWSHNRETCLKAMSHALEHYEIIGVPNNLSFLKRCVDHQQFRDGGVTTNFIGDNLKELLPNHSIYNTDIIAGAAIYLYTQRENDGFYGAVTSTEPGSPFHKTNDYRINDVSSTLIDFRTINNVDIHIKLTLLPNNHFMMDIKQIHYDEDKKTILDESESVVNIGYKVEEEENGGTITLFDEVNLRCVKVVAGGNDAIHVFHHGEHVTFNLPITDYNARAQDQGNVVSPMSGKIVKLMVKNGDEVKKGDALMVMEAMKMEHIIRAPTDACINKLLFKENDFVEGGKVLVTFMNEDKED